MMPIRETFWNIPHWAEITQYALGFVTILVFVYGVFRRVQLWRHGKPENRANNIRQRLGTFLVQAVGQARVVNDVYAGIMHLAIFWGMVVLVLGTVLATVDWDVTRLFFNYQFLTDGLYIFYELVLDIFGIFLLAGLGMAIYRRYILRPEKLKNSTGISSLDDAYVIVMLALIAISGFLVEGLRIAVTQPAWANWSPIGRSLAAFFIILGDPTNQFLHLIIWSTHTLVAFVFIASIPFTKLFHIIALPTNIFFRSLRPAGELAPARYGSGPGIKDRHDFTWKQILDFEACIRCGRCQDNCPAFASGLSFSPRNVMTRLDQDIRTGNGNNLYEDVVKSEELWACTTCRACVQVCPAFIDHISTFVDMRRHLVDDGMVDPLLQGALSNIARYGNSFGQSERQRARWAQSIQPRIKDARREPVEYLWIVGDYASYNANVITSTCKTAEIFQKAGLDFGILYEGERNTGNDARRVGEEGLFEMLVEKNASVIGRCNYIKIITTDPHSYNTLKNEYPVNTIDQNHVSHYTQLMDELIASGQLKLKKKLGYKVTYHDPCYISRYNDIYDAPRRVIVATGCELIEMPRNRENSFCCGAGGGRIWMEETGVKERPCEIRIKEAAKLNGVEILVVACPKDAVMFKDAVKTTGLDGRLVIKDLSELVLEALLGDPEVSILTGEPAGLALERR